LKAPTDFQCSGSYSEGIPAEILTKTGYLFPQAHTDIMAMASLSREIKEWKGESVCNLPFCLTIEAEALGARIRLDDMKNGPRVTEYAFNHVQSLEKLQDIDFHSGRIKTILDAAASLANQNETVALNIEGPFTILSSLIDLRILYKGIRKKEKSIFTALERIEGNIVAYGLHALNSGVKILSYADPVGSLDIVGPQMYKQHSGRVAYNVLRRLTATCHSAVIHLCGKTSTALEKIGCCSSRRLSYDNNTTYMSALSELINDNTQTRIIGHSCLRQVAWQRKAPKIWEINLENQSPDNT